MEDRPMTIPDIDDVLGVLACEIDSRPRGAPAISDIAPQLLSFTRDATSLTAAFAAGAAALVEAFAAAERACCPGLDWRVDAGPPLRLRIAGTATQIDTLAALFADLAPPAAEPSP